MNLSSLLFGFNGRINRARYWLTMLIALFAVLILVFAVIFLLPALAYGLIVIGLVMTWIAVAVAAKRLHDRNKSAWWAVPFIVMPGMLNRFADRVPEDTPLFWILAAIIFVLSIWGLIELGFLRGTVGDNAYGPDPLAPAPARGPT